MTHAQLAACACAALAVVMPLLTVVGYRTGRGAHRDGAGAVAVEGAIFALLGLLTAFTFSGAYARLDARRQLIVQEANDIGTAYMRLELLPVEAQPPLRKAFLDYVTTRAAFYANLNDPIAATAQLNHATTLQNEIWRGVLAASASADERHSRLLLLPALNDMMDVTTTRAIAVQTHPPLPIYVMLFSLAGICAALTGHAMARSAAFSAVHAIGFAVVIAATFYIILDIEYPRSGLIRLDSYNQLLVNLRTQLERSTTMPAAP